LTEASIVAQRDPARVTDWQLRALATYDRDGAHVAARRREEARVKAAQPVALEYAQKSAVTTQKAADGLTAREWLVLKTLRPLFEQYDAQIAACSTRITTLETENVALQARVTGLETRATPRAHLLVRRLRGRTPCDRTQIPT
jgi:hypothetical protein